MTLTVKEIPPRPLKEWWYEEEQIDFAPIYQRKGSIWGIPTRQKLIDTVLNGFDIPKVYLADFTQSERSLDSAGLPYAVIDGKQRLQALFSFFSGHLTLSRHFVLNDDPTLPLSGLTYQQIVHDFPEVANRFASFRLTVMGVITRDEANINELFLRLNSSSPLTGAEKRNAMLGQVPELIRQLVAHPFFIRKIRFNTLRGQDSNTAAKLLLIEHAGGPFDTKKTQLDRLVSDPNWVRDHARNRSSRDEVDRAIGGFVEAMEETENVDIAHSADRVHIALDRLFPLFRDEDYLLSAQAQLPVIYLLASKTDESEIVNIRPFLSLFQKQREKNRKLSFDDSSHDPELAEYEILNRTSNDQASINGRLSILLRRFALFNIARDGSDFDDLLG